VNFPLPQPHFPGDPNYPLDGTSLLGWLQRGETAPERSLLWRTRRQAAIRPGPWKLLLERVATPYWGDETAVTESRIRLFHVATDGREWADVSAQNQNIVAQLSGELEKFDASMLPCPENTPVSPRVYGEAD